MNVLNVAKLDIAVAMLNPLEQVFSYISRYNIAVYFLYFFLYLPLVLTALVTYFESCLNESRPEVPQELME